MNVDRLSVDNGSSNRQAATQRPIVIRKGWHRPIMRYRLSVVRFHAIDNSVFRITQPRRVLSHDIEHRLNIGWRAGNDAEDFARCGLLFQSFFEFLKQSHVLDGDHGLVGKGLEERNLLISERPDFHSANQDSPDRKSLTK